MFEALSCSCEAPDCDRTLDGQPAIRFETDRGVRRVYECACGAVTVTVGDR